MIYVSSLSQAVQAAASHRPSHVISLLSPEDAFPVFPGVGAGHHHKVGVNDIPEPREGLLEPQRAHVEALLSFLDGWPAEDPLLVHCWAGVSRSTATALLARVMKAGGDPAEHVAALRAEAPHASPNPLIIAHGDDLLGLNGALLEAVAALEEAQPVMEGPVFCLPVPSTDR